MEASGVRNVRKVGKSRFVDLGSAPLAGNAEGRFPVNRYDGCVFNICYALVVKF